PAWSQSRLFKIHSCVDLESVLKHFPIWLEHVSMTSIQNSTGIRRLDTDRAAGMARSLSLPAIWLLRPLWAGCEDRRGEGAFARARSGRNGAAASPILQEPGS